MAVTKDQRRGDLVTGIIVIEEHMDQKQKSALEKITPIAEKMGFSLQHFFYHDGSRWELTRYGDNISGKISRFFKIGSNNVVRYHKDTNTIEIILRDPRLEENVKKLSEILIKESYDVKIITDFLK